MNTQTLLRHYLKRIGLEETPKPDPQGLASLHHRHLLHVPFENLSIHTNEPIELADSSLLDKIVSRRRGGLCYELNGAFAWLLKHLGFKSHLVSAEVVRDDGSYTPQHDHMAIFVDDKVPFLADVGFGDSFRYPLKLIPNLVQEEPGRAYRLSKDSDKLLLQQAILGGPWVGVFRFSLEPRDYPDFLGMCSYHMSSPDSYFQKAPMASMATAKGRITANRHKFIRTGLDGSHDEQPIESDAHFDQILQKHFGITNWRT
ncbi:MAG: arylamine N-acetyltransferase [Desulfobulbaceae bacterium]|nr:arylamine N-acetyltransferase [Desulfobulbaceae bacterium]